MTLTSPRLFKGDSQANMRLSWERKFFHPLWGWAENSRTSPPGGIKKLLEVDLGPYLGGSQVSRQDAVEI